MILLVKTGGIEAMPEWEAAFAAFAPHLRVRYWDDPEVAAEDVRYALVWEPEPGRLARFPRLRLICSSAAGVDHIIADPNYPAHVPLVRMTTDDQAQRMGEYACLAALSLLRGMKRITTAQAERRWDAFVVERTARDTRVGVMGMGHLGARSAIMLRDLGFETAGWSVTRKSLAGVESFAGAGEMERFLARSDILLCLLPDTPATRGILRADNLSLLPPGAGVINAGRGPLLVTADLIAALDSGHLSGAVLDVFNTEPLPADDPLWGHPKVIVTPHVASFGARQERARHVAAAIAAFERGDTPPGLFDAARGY
jgi:glyoxylate/hydroxypyruvate reductase A